MRKTIIRITYDPPPIPTNHFDYNAVSSGHEEEAIGYGRTARAALDNLLDQIGGVAYEVILL
ncbi:MAG: hypothetical protein EB015_22825 [Methylocystaceae bacterium]|nr:hypothetical protein [Methylocystaceae bacterium]